MKKNIIIVCAIIAIVLIAYIIYNRYGATENSKTNTTPKENFLEQNKAQSPQYSIPAGDKFIIQTTQGGIEVLNFLKNPVETIDKTVFIRETPDFSFGYFIPDSSFSIAILNKPFSINRRKAEDEFLNALGISKSDACKLTVYLSSPFSIDPAHSGENYGLSFCSNTFQK